MLLDEALPRFLPGVQDAVVPGLATLADPERRRLLAAAGLACVKSFSRDRVLDRLGAALWRRGCKGCQATLMALSGCVTSPVKRPVLATRFLPSPGCYSPPPSTCRATRSSTSNTGTLCARGDSERSSCSML